MFQMKSVWIFIVFSCVISSQLPKFAISDVVTNYFTSNAIRNCYFIFLSPKRQNIELTKSLYPKNIAIGILNGDQIKNNTATNSRCILTKLHPRNLNAWLMILFRVISQKLKDVDFFCILDLNTFDDLLLATCEKNNFTNVSKITFILNISNKYQFISGYNNSTNYILHTKRVWTAKDHYVSYKEEKNMTDIKIRALTRYKLGTLFDPTVEPHTLMDKFHLHLFLLLQEFHNFSFTLTRSNLTNEYTKNSTIGLNNKNEIIVSGTLLTSAKVDQFDFLIPFFKFRTCFIFRQPKKSTISFLKPFSVLTWKVTLLLSLLITVLLKIALKLSQAEETSWSLAAMVVLSTLCQDGDDPSPDTRDVGCKLIFFSLLVMALLLFNYYTSSMVSLLLSEEVDSEHTIEDLITSKFAVGIDKSEDTLRWIATSNVTVVQNLFKKKIMHAINKSLNIYSTTDGVDKVRCGGFVYHTDIFTAYSIIGRDFYQREICDLTEVQMIPPVMAGLVMEKSSRLSERFRISLLKLNQNGLVNKLLKSWTVLKPRCYATTDVIPLGMEQGLPAFIILLVGILSSFVILGVEVVFQKKSVINK